MGLTRAVVLGRGNGPLREERTVLERVARDLPEGYRIWSGLTLFDPSGDTHEIDAVALGHHGVYVLNVKHWEGSITVNEASHTIAYTNHVGKLVRSALGQLTGKAPWVKPLVVLTRDDAASALPDELRRHVVTPPELLQALLLGKLPGVEAAELERSPLDEALVREISRVLDGLRRRVRPGQGNLVQELQFLQRDIVADLLGSPTFQTPVHQFYVEETAALWVVACIFVRVLEGRDLVASARLRGERADLRHVVNEITCLPACEAVFAELRARMVLAPSEAGTRALIDFFWGRDAPESDPYGHDFQDARLWGDLYQEIAEPLRGAHAMLQTPRFVAEFLLDRTLEPALAEFGAGRIQVLDPACGSGQILLVAFERLVEHLVKVEPPQQGTDVARAALDRIYGVDISALATTITRIRLLLAYLDCVKTEDIATLPSLPLHVETADTLLPAALGSLLAASYEVVVCNPPYITAKDPERREKYRALYRSASGRFSLVAPFIERCFALAKGDGFVGMIVGNSFAKRLFGKPLVEDILSRLDLTLVINSSGAYIPGHAVPTIMLFGRGRPPEAPTIRVIGCKKGEAITPIVPEEGEVWSAIVTHVDNLGYEDDFVTVVEVPRSEMAQHPWMLAGRTEHALLRRLGAHGRPLSSLAAGIRVGSSSGRSGVFILPPDLPSRLALEPEVVRPFVDGEAVRDFCITPRRVALSPYRREDEKPMVAQGDERWFRFLWNYRALIETSMLSQARKKDHWWCWQRWVEHRREALRIVCPAIAQYNHFVLVRDRAVLSHTVNVIELHPHAKEEDALALVGWLNSSSASFWMRQHAPAIAPWGERPEIALSRFDPALLGALPCPSRLVDPGPLRDKVVTLVRQLNQAARDLEEQHAPARVLERWDRSSRSALIDTLGEAQMRDQVLRRKMVCLQEDLDWVIYEALGLTEGSIEPVASWASPEQRPFAWLTDAPPQGLHRHLIEPWRRRREALRKLPLLRVLEAPLYKRPFENVQEAIPEDGEEDREELGAPNARDEGYWSRTADSCEAWLLERLEDLFRESAPGLRTAEELIACLDASPGARSVFSVWAEKRRRPGTTLAELSRELLLEHTVPWLSSERFSPSGLKKRAQWQQAWDLQRRSEAGETIPSFPVPPFYERMDYRNAVSFRLRGNLDVPRERFVALTGKPWREPRYGWAGWTKKQQTAVFSGADES